MVRRLASESSHVVTSDQGDATQFPADMDIVSDVLGSRSRHKKGFGSLPRLKAFGGKRARTSTSSYSTQQQEHIDRITKENRQLREYTTAQYEFSMEQIKEVNEMKKLFQQIQDLVPGLIVPQDLLSTVRVPPPPPVIFDDADTNQPSVSVHEEDNDVENLD